MTRPLLPRTIVILASALAMLLSAALPASAATRADKLTVLAAWSQTSVASYAAWNAARLSPAPWVDYGFDWSTDYCSSSPDKPLGFAFALPCERHDFGYRNYKAVGAFADNKARIDNYFYADLKRVCARYAAIRRPACLSLAWTYYNAVHVFGSLAAVGPADLDRAARLGSAVPA